MVSAKDEDESDLDRLAYSLSGDTVFEASLNNGSEEWTELFPTSEDANFAINSSNGEIFLLRALDRDAPLGRAQWKLTVGVTDGENEAHAPLLVNVKDINDNAPFFPVPVVNASVEENGREGDDVTQVEAIDFDDPKEGSNAALTFSLVKNVIDEDSGRPIFDIDSETGRITTALCCLDREKTSSYSLQVVATDGGGLKGTGTVYVRVKDQNDNPPKFTIPTWEFFVPESTKVNETFAFLTVDDPDVINNFSFHVMPGSGPGWERFKVRSGPLQKGAIETLKPFDYEDPKQIEGFKFKVQLTDKGNDWDDPLHQASAWVLIHLLDDNDNSPVFQTPSVNLTLREDTSPGALLTHVFATDVDNGGVSQISYSLSPSSNRFKIFIIDAGGQVRLHRALDRETQNAHTIEVIATDGGNSPRSATSSLLVSVTDINDNAPFIKTPKKVLLTENEGPQVLAELILDDADDWTLGHGPPFHVAMDTNANSDIKDSFAVFFNPNGDEGRGSGILRSLLPLDRENGKTRYVPLVVKDSEGMSATVTLPVTIGDVNDNPMASGVKRVKVLRPKNARYKIPLGRIFVEDPDDWDANDKVWRWAHGNAHPMFTLDTNSGQLIAEKNVLDNEYHLFFRVSDRTHHQSNIPAEVYVVMETVNVDVETYHLVIPLYIGSHSPEQLIIPDEQKEISPLEALMQELKSATKEKVQLLALSKGSQAVNAKAFRLNSRKEWLKSYSVVWLKAWSRPFLGQLILTKQEEIVKKTKVRINAVGIGICAHFKDLKYYVYHHKRKGYRNEYNNSYLKYSWVIDANITSLITPVIEPTKTCNCQRKGTQFQGRQSDVGHSQALQIKTTVNALRSCTPNPCMNGGRCILSTQGPKCICPYGTEKILCKQASRRFERDGGWMQVTPLSSCSNLHISLEFRTTEQQGVLIFTESPSNEYFLNTLETSSELKNLFYLEIKNGRPYLFIKTGMTEMSLTLSAEHDHNSGNFSEETPRTFSDGKWHRVDFFWTKRSVHLLVAELCQKVPDQCHSSAYYPDESYHSFVSSSNASHSVSWNSPLHIGGPPQGPTQGVNIKNEQYLSVRSKTPFRGCLRNLRINEKIIDLGLDNFQNKTTSGCDDGKLCRRNNFLGCSPETKGCLKKINQESCPCTTSEIGEKECNKPMSPSTFGMKSAAVTISPTFTVPKQMTTVQLRFRTWNPFGQLVVLRPESSTSVVLLYLFDGHLCSLVVVNVASPSPKGFFSSLNFTLCLLQTTLNDGQWHSANFHRNGILAELWAEGGDWPFYNATLLHLPLGSTPENAEAPNTKVANSENLSRETSRKERVQFINEQNIVIRIAGHPDYFIPEARKTHKHYFDGCLDAIYLWGRYLPLPLRRNDVNWADFSDSQNVVETGCQNPPVCLNVTCPKPLKCIDIWKRHKCSCGEGRILSENGKTCVDINECLWKPCLRGGTCVNEDSGYSCLCPAGFSGKNCETPSVEKISESFPIGVVIGIMTCCCFIILGLLALFILYLRRRKKRRKCSLQTMSDTGSYPEQKSSSFIVGMDHFDIATPEGLHNIAHKQDKLLEVDVLRVNLEPAQAKPTSLSQVESDDCQQLLLRCRKIFRQNLNEDSSDIPISLCHNIPQSSENVPHCRRKGRRRMKEHERKEGPTTLECKEQLSSMFDSVGIREENQYHQHSRSRTETYHQ